MISQWNVTTRTDLITTLLSNPNTPLNDCLWDFNCNWGFYDALLIQLAEISYVGSIKAWLMQRLTKLHAKTDNAFTWPNVKF